MARREPSTWDQRGDCRNGQPEDDGSRLGNHPEFVHTLEPWRLNGPAPAIVRDMIAAGRKAGTGRMAAVSGAVAEHVGKGLLKHTVTAVVENGGDIFFNTHDSVTIGIFAGRSPLSMKIGLRLQPQVNPVSVCTSSGTVGHSLSMGKADAVCVVSPNCSLADAVATSMGNRVNSRPDIQEAIDFGKTIDGVSGLVVIRGKHIGMWGNIEVVPLYGKKG